MGDRVRNPLAANLGGWRVVLAAVLTAFLACQPVLSALPAWGSPGDERHHDSCPMHRPAKRAAPPACHETEAAGAQHEGHSMAAAAPAPAPAQPGASCSLYAACGCGHPHSPSTPHRDTPAVLAAPLAGWHPLPAGLVALRPGSAPKVTLPVPEPPPPRA